MKEIMTPSEAITHIKTEFWEGLEYCPTRKDATDNFSTLAGLLIQTDALKNDGNIFFMVPTVGNVSLKILKIKVEIPR